MHARHLPSIWRRASIQPVHRSPFVDGDLDVRVARMALALVGGAHADSVPQNGVRPPGLPVLARVDVALPVCLPAHGFLPLGRAT